MSMTKTDYEMIARVLRVFNDPDNYYMSATTQAIAKALAGVLEVDNNKFKRNAFLADCGIGHE